MSKSGHVELAGSRRHLDRGGRPARVQIRRRPPVNFSFQLFHLMVGDRVCHDRYRRPGFSLFPARIADREARAVVAAGPVGAGDPRSRIRPDGSPPKWAAAVARLRTDAHPGDWSASSKANTVLASLILFTLIYFLLFPCSSICSTTKSGMDRTSGLLRLASWRCLPETEINAYAPE